MTEEQLNTLCESIGNEFINFYAALCAKYSKAIIMTALTGAFAVCCTEAGVQRKNAVEALNSAFDDIEAT